MAVIIKRVFYRGVTSGGASGPAQRHLQSFDTPDWNLAGADYTFTIDFTTHQISSSPTVTVYFDNTVTFEEVIVPVFINSVGDVTITVSSSPDNRFKGKVVIV